MKKLLLALVLFTPSAFANGIDDKCPQHTIWGAPVAKQTDVLYLCRSGYAVDYSTSLKTPVYVVEHVTKDHLAGSEARKNDFREDQEIPAAQRSTLAEWAGSGYDRGHVAPAADFTYDAKVMSESFLLSNMMAQDPGNNRGIWKYTEEMQRAAALKLGEVYVISGTIFAAGNNKKMGTVGVPNAMYKIIIDPKGKKYIAFRFDNVKLEVKNLEKYVVTIADLEKETGINFDPKLSADLKAFESTKASLADWK